MKTFLPVLLILLGGALSAQTMHYFEIGLRLDPQVPGTDWRDTSFIVAANDPAILDMAAQELAKPVDERTRHLSGSLAAGNGGFNRNDSFWFSWHILPNAWSLADFSIEVCDGRPYSDVEQDTAYWIGTVGNFCPWSSYLKREIAAPVGAETPPGAGELAFRVTPNPVGPEALFSWNMPAPAPAALTIKDLQGKLSLTMYLGDLQQGACIKPVSTSAFDNGLYVAILEVSNRRFSQPFLVQH